VAVNKFRKIDVPKDAQPQMWGLGDENIDQSRFAPGSVVVTNGIVGSEVAQQRKWDWTIDTHDKLGALTLADGSVAQVSAEGLRKAVAEATNTVTSPVVEFYDEAISRSVAQNGDFKTALT